MSRSPLMLVTVAAASVVLSSTPNDAPAGSAAPPSSVATVSAAVAQGPLNDPVDGVAMVYPTKPGGQVWHLTQRPASDDRLDGTRLSPNGDGTFTVRDTKTRLGVSTSTYDQDRDEDRLVWDQSRLSQRGYMHDVNDWRNVELTGYVRYNAGTDDDAFTWYARGARHTGSGRPPEACWGSAYKGDLRFSDGAVRFEKEIYHDGGAGYASERYRNGGASLKGRTTGFKVVIYRIPRGVRLEIYLDRADTNEWTKVLTRDDTGAWRIDGPNPCRGSTDQVLSWGGPKAAFRWDKATDVEVSRLSVREIVPPDGGGDPPCGAPTRPSTATASTWESANPPTRAVDGDLTTRWSGQGFGAGLVLDLGQARQVCGTAVAWHRGDLRWNDYTVYTSTDGTAFTKAWEGRSSGRTTAFETVTFPARTARYVRISFWQNPENDWASITEARVLSTPTPAS